MSNELGKLLKEARQQAGLSVPDVADITKIRESFIEDLEGERLDNLPSRVYVIGFLRNLGRAYKTDSEALVTAYKELLDVREASLQQQEAEKTAEDEAYIREKSGRVNQRVRPSGPAQGRMASQPAFREKDDREEEVLHSLARRSVVRRQIKAVAAVLLLLGFIVVFVYGLWHFNDGTEPAPPDDPGVSDGMPEDPAEPSGPPAPVRPEPEPEPEPGGFEPQEYRYISPEPVDAGLDIMVRVRDDGQSLSWLRAEVDGSRVFEGTLQAGEVIRLFAADVVNVRIGDAGAVELYRDGTLLPFEGQRGAVVDQVFTVE